MSDNMQLYNQGRNVPAEALKEIAAGRLKGFSDINPMWRMKRLTEMFGPVGFGWKYVIVNQRLEQGHGHELVAFVDINLYVKYNGEWSEAIPGIGGSSFTTQEKHGVHTSDECFKMALTDAIGVACKALGIAADVYFAKDRSKYDNYDQSQERPQASQARPSQTPSVNTPRSTETPQLPPVQSSAQENNSNEPMISDKQIKFIHTLVTRKQIGDAGYRELLMAMYGVATSEVLTGKQAREFITYLQK